MLLEADVEQATHTLSSSVVQSQSHHAASSGKEVPCSDVSTREYCHICVDNPWSLVRRCALHRSFFPFPQLWNYVINGLFSERVLMGIVTPPVVLRHADCVSYSFGAIVAFCC